MPDTEIKQVQLRRGTTIEHGEFTGAPGELTIDTDKNTAVVHDGFQVGGYPLAKEGDIELAIADVDAKLARRVEAVQTLAGLRAMQGMQPSQAAAVTGTDRAATYKWSSDNLSSEVASDPQMAIYVPPAGQNGSQGAWVRAIDGIAEILPPESLSDGDYVLKHTPAGPRRVPAQEVVNQSLESALSQPLPDASPTSGSKVVLRTSAGGREVSLQDAVQAGWSDTIAAGAAWFPDAAAGIAGTSEGDYFSTPSDGQDAAVLVYLHDAGGAASLVASVPSIAFVDRVASDIREIRIPLSRYTGSGPLVPLYTDAVGKVLIGVDRNDGTVFVSGSISEGRATEISEGVLGQGGFARYTGSGPVYPVVTDVGGRVLIGVDRTTGRLVGDFPGGSEAPPAPEPELPLSEPIIPKKYNHILFYGQSLSVGAAAGAVLSTTQPYSNVTFSGGPRAWDGSNWDFGPFKPLVEDEVSPAPDGGANRKETPCSGAANFASTALAIDGVLPSDHVILASTAGRGGYRIDQLEKGAPWYNNFVAHVSGAQALDADHAVHAMCWMQGEQDIVAGTPFSTYRQKLTQLLADADSDVRSETGQTSPVYLLTYQVSYGARTHSDMALAQLDMAQKESRVFLTTPTYHLPHAPDNVHLTAVGYKRAGAYFGRAYAALVRGVQPQWLNPISATIRGSAIRVRFSVPVGPLVLDDVGLAKTTDHGFAVTVGGSIVSIASISVDRSDVVLVLDSVPGGEVSVRYGLDYIGAGLTITGGGSGNLRDSSSDTILISGTDYPLWNVCPAFEMPAIRIGV